MAIPRILPAENPAVKVGFVLLCVYLVIIFSRVLDVTIATFRIASSTYLLLIIALLVSGNVLRLFATRTGRLLGAFTVWVCITIPFGIWKSGSLEAFQTALMSLVVALSLAAFGTSVERIIRLLYIIGFSSLLAALLSIPFAGYRAERLCLNQGTYNDPNEYSLMLLAGIPSWMLWIKRSKTLPGKMVGAAALLFILRTCLLTGSRGALLAFATLAVVLFLRASILQKFGVLLSLAGVLVLAAAILPDYLRARYFTFFNTEVQDVRLREKLERSDTTSANGRWEVFKDSLVMTWEHPITGVGPGNFQTAIWDKKKKETGKNLGIVSHNSYTGVSSETGIPGLILFLAALVSPFTMIRRLRKSAKLKPTSLPPETQDASTHLQFIMILVYAGAFFLSIAYNPIFYALSGLASGLEYTVRSQIASAQLPTPPVWMTQNPLRPNLALPAK